MDTEEILDILRERRGLWYEYAPYIGALTHRGWSPGGHGRSRGIQGSEQSIMVVGAQVGTACQGACRQGHAPRRGGAPGQP